LLIDEINIAIGMPKIKVKENIGIEGKTPLLNLDNELRGE